MIFQDEMILCNYGTVLSVGVLTVCRYILAVFTFPFAVEPISPIITFVGSPTSLCNPPWLMTSRRREEDEWSRYTTTRLLPSE